MTTEIVSAFLSAVHVTATSSGSGQKTLGYVLAGVGVAGLVTGIVAGVMVLGDKSTVDANCDADKRCNAEGLDAAERGKTMGIVTTVGLVTGAVGLGAGVAPGAEFGVVLDAGRAALMVDPAQVVVESLAGLGIYGAFRVAGVLAELQRPPVAGLEESAGGVRAGLAAPAGARDDGLHGLPFLVCRRARVTPRAVAHSSVVSTDGV